MLAQTDWTAWITAVIGFVGGLAAATVGSWISLLLQRRQENRNRIANARYRVYVKLIELQRHVATAVYRQEIELATKDDALKRCKDSELKFILGFTTQSLQEDIIGLLRASDDLPELCKIRQALWAPGTGASDWLGQLKKTIEELAKVVSPRLVECEARLYSTLPEHVRLIIEHPEKPRAQGPARSDNEE